MQDPIKTYSQDIPNVTPEVPPLNFNIFEAYEKGLSTEEILRGLREEDKVVIEDAPTSYKNYGKGMDEEEFSAIYDDMLNMTRDLNNANYLQTTYDLSKFPALQRYHYYAHGTIPSIGWAGTQSLRTRAPIVGGGAYSSDQEVAAAKGVYYYHDPETEELKSDKYTRWKRYFGSPVETRWDEEGEPFYYSPEYGEDIDYQNVVSRLGPQSQYGSSILGNVGTYAGAFLPMAVQAASRLIQSLLRPSRYPGKSESVVGVQAGSRGEDEIIRGDDPRYIDIQDKRWVIAIDNAFTALNNYLETLKPKVSEEIQSQKFFDSAASAISKTADFLGFVTPTVVELFLTRGRSYKGLTGLGSKWMTMMMVNETYKGARDAGLDKHQATNFSLVMYPVYYRVGALTNVAVLRRMLGSVSEKTLWKNYTSNWIKTQLPGLTAKMAKTEGAAGVLQQFSRGLNKFIKLEIVKTPAHSGLAFASYSAADIGAQNIWDDWFSDDDALVGQGKYGTEVLSDETIPRLWESFTSGMILGSVSAGYTKGIGKLVNWNKVKKTQQEQNRERFIDSKIYNEGGYEELANYTRDKIWKKKRFGRDYIDWDGETIVQGRERASFEVPEDMPEWGLKKGDKLTTNNDRNYWNFIEDVNLRRDILNTSGHADKATQERYFGDGMGIYKTISRDVYELGERIYDRKKEIAKEEDALRVAQENKNESIVKIVTDKISVLEKGGTDSKGKSVIGLNDMLREYNDYMSIEPGTTHSKKYNERLVKGTIKAEIAGLKEAFPKISEILEPATSVTTERINKVKERANELLSVKTNLKERELPDKNKALTEFVEGMRDLEVPNMVETHKELKDINNRIITLINKARESGIHDITGIDEMITSKIKKFSDLYKGALQKLTEMPGDMDIESIKETIKADPKYDTSEVIWELGTKEDPLVTNEGHLRSLDELNKMTSVASKYEARKDYDYKKEDDTDAVDRIYLDDIFAEMQILQSKSENKTLGTDADIAKLKSLKDIVKERMTDVIINSSLNRIDENTKENLSGLKESSSDYSVLGNRLTDEQRSYLTGMYEMLNDSKGERNLGIKQLLDVANSFNKDRINREVIRDIGMNRYHNDALTKFFDIIEPTGENKESLNEVRTLFKEIADLDIKLGDTYDKNIIQLIADKTVQLESKLYNLTGNKEVLLTNFHDNFIGKSTKVSTGEVSGRGREEEFLGKFGIITEYTLRTPGPNNGRVILTGVESKVSSDGELLIIKPKCTFKDSGEEVGFRSNEMTFQEFKDKYYPLMTEREIDYFESTLGDNVDILVFKEMRIALTGRSKGQVNLAIFALDDLAYHETGITLDINKTRDINANYDKELNKIVSEVPGQEKWSYDIGEAIFNDYWQLDNKTGERFFTLPYNYVLENQTINIDDIIKMTPAKLREEHISALVNDNKQYAQQLASFYYRSTMNYLWSRLNTNPKDFYKSVKSFSEKYNAPYIQQEEALKMIYATINGTSDFSAIMGNRFIGANARNSYRGFAMKAIHINGGSGTGKSMVGIPFTLFALNDKSVLKSKFKVLITSASDKLINILRKNNENRNLTKLDIEYITSDQMISRMEDGTITGKKYDYIICDETERLSERDVNGKGGTKWKGLKGVLGDKNTVLFSFGDSKQSTGDLRNSTELQIPIQLEAITPITMTENVRTDVVDIANVIMAVEPTILGRHTSTREIVNPKTVYNSNFTKGVLFLKDVSSVIKKWNDDQGKNDGRKRTLIVRKSSEKQDIIDELTNKGIKFEKDNIRYITEDKRGRDKQGTILGQEEDFVYSAVEPGTELSERLDYKTAIGRAQKFLVTVGPVENSKLVEDKDIIDHSDQKSKDEKLERDQKHSKEYLARINSFIDNTPGVSEPKEGIISEPVEREPIDIEKDRELTTLDNPKTINVFELLNTAKSPNQNIVNEVLDIITDKIIKDKDKLTEREKLIIKHEKYNDDINRLIVSKYSESFKQVDKSNDIETGKSYVIGNEIIYVDNISELRNNAGDVIKTLINGKDIGISKLKPVEITAEVDPDIEQKVSRITDEDKKKIVINALQYSKKGNKMPIMLVGDQEKGRIVSEERRVKWMKAASNLNEKDKLSIVYHDEFNIWNENKGVREDSFGVITIQSGTESEIKAGKGVIIGVFPVPILDYKTKIEHTINDIKKYDDVSVKFTGDNETELNAYYSEVLKMYRYGSEVSNNERKGNQGDNNHIIGSFRYSKEDLVGGRPVYDYANPQDIALFFKTMKEKGFKFQSSTDPLKSAETVDEIKVIQERDEKTGYLHYYALGSYLDSTKPIRIELHPPKLGIEGISKLMSSVYDNIEKYKNEQITLERFNSLLNKSESYQLLLTNQNKLFTPGDDGKIIWKGEGGESLSFFLKKDGKYISLKGSDLPKSVYEEFGTDGKDIVVNELISLYKVLDFMKRKLSGDIRSWQKISNREGETFVSPGDIKQLLSKAKDIFLPNARGTVTLNIPESKSTYKESVGKTMLDSENDPIDFMKKETISSESLEYHPESYERERGISILGKSFVEGKLLFKPNTTVDGVSNYAHIRNLKMFIETRDGMVVKGSILHESVHYVAKHLLDPLSRQAITRDARKYFFDEGDTAVYSDKEIWEKIAELNRLSDGKLKVEYKGMTGLFKQFMNWLSETFLNIRLFGSAMDKYLYKLNNGHWADAPPRYNLMNDNITFMEKGSDREPELREENIKGTYSVAALSSPEYFGSGFQVMKVKRFIGEKILSNSVENGNIKDDNVNSVAQSLKRLYDEIKTEYSDDKYKEYDTKRISDFDINDGKNRYNYSMRKLAGEDGKVYNSVAQHLFKKLKINEEIIDRYTANNFHNNTSTNHNMTMGESVKLHLTSIPLNTYKIVNSRAEKDKDAGRGQLAKYPILEESLLNAGINASTIEPGQKGMSLAERWFDNINKMIEENTKTSIDGPIIDERANHLLSFLERFKGGKEDKSDTQFSHYYLSTNFRDIIEAHTGIKNDLHSAVETKLGAVIQAKWVASDNLINGILSHFTSLQDKKTHFITVTNTKGGKIFKPDTFLHGSVNEGKNRIQQFMNTKFYSEGELKKGMEDMKDSFYGFKYEVVTSGIIPDSINIMGGVAYKNGKTLLNYNKKNKRFEFVSDINQEDIDNISRYFGLGIRQEAINRLIDKTSKTYTLDELANFVGNMFTAIKATTTPTLNAFVDERLPAPAKGKGRQISDFFDDIEKVAKYVVAVNGEISKGFSYNPDGEKQYNYVPNNEVSKDFGNSPEGGYASDVARQKFVKKFKDVDKSMNALFNEDGTINDPMLARDGLMVMVEVSNLTGMKQDYMGRSVGLLTRQDYYQSILGEYFSSVIANVKQQQLIFSAGNIADSDNIYMGKYIFDRSDRSRWLIEPLRDKEGEITSFIRSNASDEMINNALDLHFKAAKRASEISADKWTKFSGAKDVIKWINDNRIVANKQNLSDMGKYRLTENFDYIIKTDKDGNNIVIPGRALLMQHDIFNYDNYNRWINRGSLPGEKGEIYDRMLREHSDLRNSMFAKRFVLLRNNINKYNVFIHDAIASTIEGKRGNYQFIKPRVDEKGKQVWTGEGKPLYDWHPLFEAYLYGKFITNTSFDNVTTGNSLLFKNEQSKSRRNKLSSSSGYNTITDRPRTLPSKGYNVKIYDPDFRYKEASLLFGHEKDNGLSTDGYIIGNPVHIAQYSNGLGGENSIVKNTDAVLKTSQTGHNSITGNAKWIKSTTLRLDSNDVDTPKGRALLEFFLTGGPGARLENGLRDRTLIDRYDMFRLQGLNHNDAGIALSDWMIREKLMGNNYDNFMVSNIIHQSADKINTDEVNIIDFKNPDYDNISYTEHDNNSTYAILNLNQPVRDLSQNDQLSRVTVVTQQNTILGIENHERIRQIDNIDKRLAELQFESINKDIRDNDGFVNYGRKILAESLDKQNNISSWISLVNNPNIDMRLPSSEQKISQLIASKITKGIKGKTSGGKMTQAPDESLEYYKFLDNEGNNLLDVIEKEHPELEQQIKELANLKKNAKVDPSEINIASYNDLLNIIQSVQREYISRIDKVIPAQARISYVYLEKFGATPNTTLEDLLTIKIKDGTLNIRDYVKENSVDYYKNREDGLKALRAHMIIMWSEGNSGHAFDYGVRNINDFMNYSEHLLNALDVNLSRVPFSQWGSGHNGEIIGLLKEDSNILYTSPRKSLFDNSDYDGDQLTVLWRNIQKNKSETGYDPFYTDKIQNKIEDESNIDALYNAQFNLKYESYNDPKNTDKIMQPSNMDELKSLVIDDKKDMEYNYSNDLSTDAENFNVSHDGNQVISRFVNLQHFYSKVNHLSPELRRQYISGFNFDTITTDYSKVAIQGRVKYIVGIISQYSQAAFDNPKETILGLLNINTTSSNIVSSLVLSKWSMPEIKDFLTDPVIKNIIVQVAQSRSIGEVTKNIDDVISEKINSYEGKNEDAFIESERQAKVDEFTEKIQDIKNDKPQDILTLKELQDKYKYEDWELEGTALGKESDIIGAMLDLQYGDARTDIKTKREAIKQYEKELKYYQSDKFFKDQKKYFQDTLTKLGIMREMSRKGEFINRVMDFFTDNQGFDGDIQKVYQDKENKDFYLKKDEKEWGNGIQAVNLEGYGKKPLVEFTSQSDVDSYTSDIMTKTFSEILSLHPDIRIEGINRGQSGFDEAGAKVMSKHDMPVEIVMPKGNRYRDINGVDQIVGSTKRFKGYKNIVIGTPHISWNYADATRSQIDKSDVVISFNTRLGLSEESAGEKLTRSHSNKMGKLFIEINPLKQSREMIVSEITDRLGKEIRRQEEVAKGIGVNISEIPVKLKLYVAGNGLFNAVNTPKSQYQKFLEHERGVRSNGDIEGMINSLSNIKEYEKQFNWFYDKMGANFTSLSKPMLKNIDGFRREMKLENFYRDTFYLLQEVKNMNLADVFFRNMKNPVMDISHRGYGLYDGEKSSVHRIDLRKPEDRDYFWLELSEYIQSIKDDPQNPNSNNAFIKALVIENNIIKLKDALSLPPELVDVYRDAFNRIVDESTGTDNKQDLKRLLCLYQFMEYGFKNKGFIDILGDMMLGEVSETIRPYIDEIISGKGEFVNKMQDNFTINAAMSNNDLINNVNPSVPRNTDNAKVYKKRIIERMDPRDFNSPIVRDYSQTYLRVDEFNSIPIYSTFSGKSKTIPVDKSMWSEYETVRSTDVGIVREFRDTGRSSKTFKVGHNYKQGQIINFDGVVSKIIGITENSITFEKVSPNEVINSQIQIKLPISKMEEERIKNITGINISSYETGLGGQLTNFANIPIVFNGKKYKSSEQAYQDNKTGLSDIEVKKLMTDVITAKLQQHPNLVEDIDRYGGIDFLNKSTHNLIKEGKTIKSDRWTGQHGLFMQSLREAYSIIKGIKVEPYIASRPLMSEIIKENRLQKNDLQVILKQVRKAHPDFEFKVVNNETTTSPGDKAYIKNGIVHYNEDLVTYDTPIHEVAAPWLIALKTARASLYEMIISKAREEVDNNSELYKAVKNKYPELSDQELMDELGHTMIGLRSEGKVAELLQRETRTTYDRLKGWVNDIWKDIVGWIKEKMGWRDSVDNSENTYGQLIDNFISNVLSGKVISTLDKYDMMMMKAKSKDLVDIDRKMTDIKEIKDDLLIRKGGIESVEDYKTDQEVNGIYQQLVQSKDKIYDRFPRKFNFQKEFEIGELAVKMKIFSEVLPEYALREKENRDKLINWADSGDSKINGFANTDGSVIKKFFSVGGREIYNDNAIEKFKIYTGITPSTRVYLYSELKTRFKDDKDLIKVFDKEFIGEDPMVMIHNITRDKSGKLVNIDLSLFDVSMRSLRLSNIGFDRKLITENYLSKYDGRKKGIDMYASLTSVRQLTLGLTALKIINEFPEGMVNLRKLGVIRLKNDDTLPMFSNIRQLLNNIKVLKDIPDFVDKLPDNVQKLITNDKLYEREYEPDYFTMIRNFTEQRILDLEEEGSAAFYRERYRLLNEYESGKGNTEEMIEVFTLYQKYLDKKFTTLEERARLEERVLDPERNFIAGFLNSLRRLKEVKGQKNRLNDVSLLPSLITNPGNVTSDVGQEFYTRVTMKQNEVAGVIRRELTDFNINVNDKLKKLYSERAFVPFGITSLAIDISEQPYKRLMMTSTFKGENGEIFKDKDGNDTEYDTKEIHWTTDDVRTQDAISEGKITMEEVEIGNYIAEKIEKLVKDLMRHEIVNNDYEVSKKDYTKGTITVNKELLEKKVNSKYNTNTKKGLLPVMTKRTAQLIMSGNRKKVWKGIEKFTGKLLTTQETLTEVVDIMGTGKDPESIQSIFSDQFDYSPDPNFGGSERMRLMGLRMVKGEVILSDPLMIESANGNINDIYKYLVTDVNRKIEYENHLIPDFINAAIALKNIELMKGISQARNLWVLKEIERKQVLGKSSLESDSPTWKNIRVAAQVMRNITQFRGVALSIPVGITNFTANTIEVALIAVSVSLEKLGAHNNPFRLPGVPDMTKALLFYMDARNHRLIERLVDDYQIIENEITDLINDQINDPTRKLLLSSKYMHILTRVGDSEWKKIAMLGQMIHDGSLKAHYLDADGNSAYDATQDRRYFNEDGSQTQKQKAIMDDVIKSFKEDRRWKDKQNESDLPVRSYDLMEQENFKWFASEFITGYYNGNENTPGNNYISYQVGMQFKKFMGAKIQARLGRHRYSIKGGWRDVIIKDEDGSMEVVWNKLEKEGSWRSTFNYFNNNLTEVFKKRSFKDWQKMTQLERFNLCRTSIDVTVAIASWYLFRGVGYDTIKEKGEALLANDRVTRAWKNGMFTILTTTPYQMFDMFTSIALVNECKALMGLTMGQDIKKNLQTVVPGVPSYITLDEIFSEENR